MQAIRTKYIGPTNTRPARVKAECERGNLTVEWAQGLGVDSNHRRAAQMLLTKFSAEDVKEYGGVEADHHWGELVSGQLTDGCGVHVLIGRLGTFILEKEVVADLRKWRDELKAGRGRGGIELGRLAAALDSAVGSLDENTTR